MAGAVVFNNVLISTFANFLRLKTQFPLKDQMMPVMLMHQMYALVKDRTQVDRELVGSCSTALSILRTRHFMGRTKPLVKPKAFVACGRSKRRKMLFFDSKSVSLLSASDHELNTTPFQVYLALRVFSIFAIFSRHVEERVYRYVCELDTTILKVPGSSHKRVCDQLILLDDH